MPVSRAFRLTVLAIALLVGRAVLAGDLPPDRAAALERLVIQDCGSCHGLTLKGGLGPDIRAAALEGTEPESLAAIILDGVPGTAMPPWRPLLSERGVPPVQKVEYAVAPTTWCYQESMALGATWTA